MLRCRRLAVLAAVVFVAAALAPAAAIAATRGFMVYNGSDRPMVVARFREISRDSSSFGGDFGASGAVWSLI